MKRLFTVFICATLVIISSDRAHAQKVLVNIWDGTEWKKIRRLFVAGQLPHAASVGELFRLTCNTDCFSDCGCRNCCMRTATKPQHATMLTGFLADVHGVFHNTCYQVIPDGLTVYEEIEDLDPSIKTAHISGKPRNFGERTFGNIIEDVDFFVAEVMSPRAGANHARRLIREWHQEDFFIVCHFKQPDEKGHKHGVRSTKYQQSIVYCDEQLGSILDQLVEYGILGETAIYILSDHGFGTPRRHGHKYAPNTFIISNDPNMRNIQMKEVACFLLSNFDLCPNP